MQLLRALDKSKMWSYFSSGQEGLENNLDKAINWFK